MQTRISVILLAVSALACDAHDASKPGAPSAGAQAVDAAIPSVDAQPAVPDAGEPYEASVDSGNEPPPITGTLNSDYLNEAHDGWSTLITTNWELAAGQEGYLCIRSSVARVSYLHEFSALMNPGTHHALLMLEQEPVHPDGVSVCDIDRSGRRIFDSNDFTAGTPAHMLLPDGIAVPIAAGRQLLLNLHLLNLTDRRISGTSGILVKTLEEAQVSASAQTLSVGPTQLQIPSGSVTVKSQCRWPQAATVFAVAPHMHELGSYMKVVARTADKGDVVLLDARYSFDWQSSYATERVPMQPGDQIVLECTFQNPAARNVGFGQRAGDEMCQAAVSVYPELDGDLPVCD